MGEGEVRSLPGFDSAQMAAVDEDQLRHLAHLPDLDGSQEKARAEDHARDPAAACAGDGGRYGMVVDAVPGQMHHPVTLGEERLDDAVGARLLADAGDDLEFLGG